MADSRSRTSVRTAALARTGTVSRAASPVSPPAIVATGALREQREELSSALCAVRDYLQLLADCAGCNSDNSALLHSESLAVAFGDLSADLQAIESRFAALAVACHTGDADTGRSIESLGNKLYAVRHLLHLAHDAIGHYSRDSHAVHAEAFGATMDRMAERVRVVNALFLALAYPSDSAPAAPVHAGTRSAAPAASHARPTRARMAQEAACA